MPVLHDLDELGRVGLHVVQGVEADHERRPCQRLDIVQIDRLGTLCQVSLAGCPAWNEMAMHGSVFDEELPLGRRAISGPLTAAPAPAFIEEQAAYLC